MLLVVTFIVSMLLLGCNNDKKVTTIEEPILDEKEVIEKEPDEEVAEEEIVVPKFPHTYPLTGIGTDENTNHRVIGVMIENSKSARPQSGLYKADLVYEVLSEGTITRLLAFYHSEQPELIGPVRSARDYYINLNNGYNALYVSAGGSPGAFDMINSGKVDHLSGLTYDGTYFHRSKARKAPHNMYTSYENLIKVAERIGYSTTDDVPILPFTEKENTLSGIEAKEVEIDYGSSTNNVKYKFEPETGRYLRYIGGEQSIDLEDKQPVVADNVFIVETSHRVVDSVGRREVNLLSGGNALLFQNGQVQKVEWKNVDGRLLPFSEGKSIGFIPGKTWINLIPTSPGIEKSIKIN